MSQRDARIPEVAFVCWINGVRYDDRNVHQTVRLLRELGGIPDDHDFFAMGDAPGEQDVRLPREVYAPDEPVLLTRWNQFYSTPRIINAG